MVLNSGVGGSGVLATELGLWLSNAGHQVHFVATSVPFRLGDDACENVYFHKIASMTYPLFESPLVTLSEASKLVEVCEQYEIDVVHAHYAIPHAAAALLARQMMRKAKRPAVITTLHGTDVTLVGLDPAYLRATQWSIESSDVVTAVSHYLAAKTTSKMAVREGDIAVVHNGVDINRFRPQANSAAVRRRYAEPQERLLVHVSNFRAVKRTDDVVRVFAKVAAALPARLVMVGDGPERPRAVAMATELGVNEKISFVGTLPHIEALLASADLFLLPSAQESFGLSALEAMASGVPIVATAIGGLPEVVEDGVSGFLHPLGDVDAMAASALRLLRDQGELEAFRGAARRRAVERFDESLVFPGYLELYGLAIERAGHGMGAGREERAGDAVGAGRVERAGDAVGEGAKGGGRPGRRTASERA